MTTANKMQVLKFWTKEEESEDFNEDFFAKLESAVDEGLFEIIDEAGEVSFIALYYLHKSQTNKLTNQLAH